MAVVVPIAIPSLCIMIAVVSLLATVVPSPFDSIAIAIGISLTMMVMVINPLLMSRMLHS
jgi:hypothetical protein